MHYRNGDTVQLGDKVHLGNDEEGVVVGIIDESRYADGYSGADWEFLGHGLVVSTELGDLRLPEPDEDLELLSRPEPRYRRRA
jgi:hypothetical protein